jgi:hypothetical protein
VGGVVVQHPRRGMTRAWHIEEREYAGQEGRGGRWHAFERIEPQRTALVVIDVVPSFVEDVVCCRGIVPSISRLASRVRTTGGMVAWGLPGPSGRRYSCCQLGVPAGVGAGHTVFSRSQTPRGSQPRKCLTDWRYSHSMASLRR